MSRHHDDSCGDCSYRERSDDLTCGQFLGALIVIMGAAVGIAGTVALFAAVYYVKARVLT